MPSTTNRSLDRARVSIAGGAGGGPLGEAPATPSEILGQVSDDIRRKLPDDVVDELLAGARTEEEIVEPGGVLAQLTKRLVERAMEVELTDHLGYEPHREPPGGAGNTRNGSTSKTLITESGEVRIDTPRDRAGTFEPQIVRKRQIFDAFELRILYNKIDRRIEISATISDAVARTLQNANDLPQEVANVTHTDIAGAGFEPATFGL